MHIYFFSPIPFHFLHQRPQKFAGQFLARNIPVTYIEPGGWQDYFSGKKKGLVHAILISFLYHIRAIMVAFAPRSHQRRQSREHNDEKNNAGALQILSLPLIIPTNQYNSALLDKINAAVFRCFLQRNIFPSMKKNELHVAFVEHPFWGSVLQPTDFDGIYYDCIDELMLYVGQNSLHRFTAYEITLVGMSEAVFVTARKLEEHLRASNSAKAMFRIPNGVDPEWFTQRANHKAVQSDLQDVKKPIVGYIGALYEWRIDFKLLRSLVERFSEISFIFIGPVRDVTTVQELTVYKNFFWLGEKPYSDVPVYMNMFDVCLIPFRVGRISETTNPIKLFEYFALGKPVVTTHLLELEQYRDIDLVYMAESPEECIEAIELALKENDDEKRRRRMEIAANNSWRSHVDKILNVIESKNNLQRTDA